MTWNPNKPDDTGEADRVDPLTGETVTVTVREIRQATRDGDGTVIIYEE